MKSQTSCLKRLKQIMLMSKPETDFFLTEETLNGLITEAKRIFFEETKLNLEFEEEKVSIMVGRDIVEINEKKYIARIHKFGCYERAVDAPIDWNISLI